MNRDNLLSLILDAQACVQQHGDNTYTVAGETFETYALECRLEEGVAFLEGDEPLLDEGVTDEARAWGPAGPPRDDERSWGEDDRYTDDDMEAALCMWEHVLEQLRGPSRTAWHMWTESVGMASARSTVMQFAKRCAADYEKAKADETSAYHVENQCFDWEWVPDWMEEHRGEITA